MIGSFVQQNKSAEEQKYAKILQRKQIQKRLQGLTASEYQKIVSNLKTQNEKLKAEVASLNQKVEQLVQSRKIGKNKNPQIEQEVARLKKELDLKYQSMSYLKETIKKMGQSDMTEEMKIKIKERENIVNQFQKQFKELQMERENMKLQISKNEEDLKQFVQVSDPEGKMQSLKAQNKQLKQKIQTLKDKLTLQQKNSKETIGKIYQLKDEEKRGLTKSSREISMSLKEIKSTSISQINQLQKEIQSLKNKKKEAEKDIVSDKIIKQAKKSRLQKQIKDNLQKQKQLYKRRVKGINQLNLYEQKDILLRQKLQKQAEVVNKEYLECEAQTTKIVPIQFRKEWVGKSQGLPFNDADIIEYKEEILIKAVTVYKTTENIVFTKFHYQSPEKKRYESEAPFQKFILKKCESKKYESKSQAPLSGLTVSYHSANKKITRIQFKWGDGDSSVIGWDVEGITKYFFDISAKQRPVCMFGSVNSIGKFSYVLQTLGCEINTIDD